MSITKKLMRLLLVLTVFGAFTSAHAGQKWLFKERLLDEDGVQYMMSGTLNDNCGGSGSMGGTINGHVYVVGTAQYIPTQCYVTYRSPDGWTFADIPANRLTNYQANITTGWSRQPCTYNLPDQDLSCATSYMIIPRAEAVYAKKMGAYTSGLGIQYAYTNQSGNFVGTPIINTDSSGKAEFRVPRTLKNGYYCYNDSIFGLIPPAASISIPTIVVPELARPNAITNAYFVNNTTLGLEWENTSTVPGVNHYAYVVQIYDRDTGATLDVQAVVSNSAQVNVPLTSNGIEIYILGYGEQNGEALYAFNAFQLDLASPSATAAMKSSRSAQIGVQTAVRDVQIEKKRMAIKKSPGLLRNARQIEGNLEISTPELKRVETISEADDCATCK